MNNRGNLLDALRLLLLHPGGAAVESSSCGFPQGDSTGSVGLPVVELT